jgi:hypothetical protein
LKKGLEMATASFQADPSRQRALVFLGDGMSSYNPITPVDRAKICENMVKNEIAFFSVPLGPMLDPQNLHGIASHTGGKVVRLVPSNDIPRTPPRNCARPLPPRSFIRNRSSFQRTK